MVFCKRTLQIFALGALALAFVIACRNKPAVTVVEIPRTAEQTPAGTRGVVGISVPTLENPYFVELCDGFTQVAIKNGYEVVAVSGDFDNWTQSSQVRDFIARKVTAIVLCPCDSKEVGTSIREANQANIPVFTADNACSDAEAKIVSHVASDNEQGGRLAAEALAGALGNKGKLAILDHPGVDSVLLRTKGFKDRIAELSRQPGAEMTIVASVPATSDRDKGSSLTLQLLAKYPDLRGIFAINDLSALGACDALEHTGRAEQVKVVGFDGLPEARRAILTGRMLADPIQKPREIGAETAQSVARHLRGEPVLDKVLIPVRLYTQKVAERDSTLKQVSVSATNN